MKADYQNYFPVESCIIKEIYAIIAGMSVCIFNSLSFFSHYHRNLKNLYKNKAVHPDNLIKGSQMIQFIDLISGKLWWFNLFIFAMILLAIYHYHMHYANTKSVYTIKRLPQKNALHKRCLTLPTLAIFSALLTMFALVLCYYAYYHINTPAESIITTQTSNFATFILEGIQ